MIPMETEHLARQSFPAVQLLHDFPPRWRDRNKLAVWEISGAGMPFAGTLDYACWPARSLPGNATGPGPFLIRDGVFDYPPEPDRDTVSWHLNFADTMLFGFYEGSLLAQDELQVAEHPALGSLRDALKAQGRAGRTEDEQGHPTPVTVAGVQRRCVIQTGADPAAGRPRALYGNAFSRATVNQVIAATTRLDPPTVSNILAIAAPDGGVGPYSADEIEGILVTAFSGFAAAAQEGARILGRSARTLVHTGFWGCGAFGGNRTLMTILQALAADLAGVELVFHAVDPQGVQAAKAAHNAYLLLRSGGDTVAKIILELEGAEYEWGESDGN
jgi:hypothetical protein